jgi:hypothetical protein
MELSIVMNFALKRRKWQILLSIATVLCGLTAILVFFGNSGHKRAGSRGESRFSKSVLSVLRNADEIEVYSIDSGTSGPGTILFHNESALGMTVVKHAAQRKDIISSLEHASLPTSSSFSMLCFNPRHAVRVKHGDKIADFLLCFECVNMSVGTENEIGRIMEMAYLFEPLLDKILTDANIPLAPKSK